MDLTKEYPRSVQHKLHGLVQLARALDKGKATAHGTNGEYNFDCPMDRELFGFLGLDGATLLEVIKKSKNEEEILAYVAPFIAKKTPEEIEHFNHEMLTHKPEGDSLKYFLNLRSQIAPDRTDVTTWPDLLDLDEKRNVPKREAVNA